MGKHRNADPSQWSDDEVREWIGELRSGIRAEREAAVADAGMRDRYFESLPEPARVSEKAAQWEVRVPFEDPDTGQERMGLAHVVQLQLDTGKVKVWLLGPADTETTCPRELAAALLAADAYRRNRSPL